MYCKYCGQQIPDQSKFCPKCGKDLRPVTADNDKQAEEKIVLKMAETPKAVLDKSVPYQPDGTVYTVPKKKKGFPVLLVIIPLLLLLAGGAAAYFFLFSKPLNPADFVTVTLDDQPEGSASAYINMDYEILTEKIGKDKMKKAIGELVGKENVKLMEEEYGVPFSDLIDQYGDYMLDSYYFYTYGVDKNSGLKNGDKITISFYPSDVTGLVNKELTLGDINKALGVRMPETYVYTVKGLRKGDESPVLTPDVPSDDQSMTLRPDLTKVSSEAIGEYCTLATLFCRYDGGIEQDASFYLDEVYALKNKDNGLNGLAFIFRNYKGQDKIIAYEDLTLSADQRHLVFNGDSVTVTDSSNNYFFNTYDFQELSSETYKNMKPAVGLYGTVTDTEVRIRSGPGTNTDKVTVDGKKVYNKGESVEIVDEARDSNGDLWYQVKFQRSGVSYVYWIFGSYVRVNYY